MDESLFFFAGALVPLVFIVLGILVKNGMGAFFPLVGALIASRITAQLATDATITVSYNPSAVTTPAYPWILVPAFIMVLSFAMPVYKAAMVRKSNASYNPAKLVLKVMFLVFLGATAAYILAPVLSALKSANFGDVALTALMGNITGPLAVASFFSFAYITFVTDD
jgi:hypothetical protein